jgi:F-type H+-transporting ATPase subunit b
MLNLDVSQIIIQIIAFLVMLWVMKRYGWKPLLDTLQARKDTIQAEFDSIVLKHEEAEQLLLEYQDKLKEIDKEARIKIQEAIAEGRIISDEIQNNAHSQAQNVLEKAKLELQGEVAKAKVQLKEDMANLIVKTTEKILQEKLDAESQSKLIAKFVEEAESLK